jgi:hypothetical protein
VLGPIIYEHPTAIAELKAMPPAQYVLTAHWQTVRSFMLDRAGHRCQTCSSRISLDVHHNNYESLGEETPYDLVVLCRDCHGIFHERRKLAQKAAAASEPPHAPRPSGPGPCPLCGAPTKRLTNKRTGARFYGCTNYPHCTGNRNES